MKATFTALLAFAVSPLFAAPITIKHLSIPVIDTNPAHPKGPLFRECHYLLDESAFSDLPRFDPITGENLFPPHQALAVAHRDYFSKHGIEAEEFYRMASVTLAKIDDYTMSAVADRVRGQGETVQNTWFYVVDCDWPRTRHMKESIAPVVILMNGEIVSPNERRKRLLEK